VIIERVHSVLSSGAFPEHPQLLVRLHPYSWNTDLRIYDHLPDVAVWPRERDLPSMLGGSTTGLVDDFRVMISSFSHAAVNVNVASTVTLDSSIFDRPVVNIAFDSEPTRSNSYSVRRFYKRTDHYKQVVETGAVDVVWKPKDLMPALARALRNPEERAKERRRLIELECGQVDGRSGRRLADALNSIHRRAPSPAEAVSAGERD
jgi:CDP-glycerol glycerophosphotransferase (TagB/SpsB family)